MGSGKASKQKEAGLNKRFNELVSIDKRTPSQQIELDNINNKL